MIRGMLAYACPNRDIRDQYREQGWMGHTPSSPCTDGSVPRIGRIATNVPHLRIKQSLVLEVLPEEVLDAPEAACRYGALLRIFGDLGWAFGVEGEAGGGGEGAEEALEEGGHLGRHDREGDEDEEAGW